jgi:hypothetical protein
MKTTTTNYEQQAIEFLKATNTTFTATFKKNDIHFPGDKEARDIYTITFERKGRKMTVDFGQSLSKSGFCYTKGKKVIQLDRSKLDQKNLAFAIKMVDHDFLNNGKSDTIHYPEAPTAYDVLACLQKYEVGTFENFCGEFGYDEDSRTAERLYKAVCKEFDDVERLWSVDEIEQLQKIQ